MTLDEGIKKIEGLITEFSKESRGLYIEILNEMGERSTNAYNAAMEDLDNNDDDDDGA